MRASRIKELLPAVFEQAAVPRRPLHTCLEVMELLHAPTESKLDELDRYLDPRRAPDEFVPFLAAWMDIDFPVSTGRIRELVAGFVEVMSLRGTRAGLHRLLELATGVTGFEVQDSPPDERGVPRPFHIAVVAPAALAADRRLLETLIARQKPAYVTSTLEFRKD